MATIIERNGRYRAEVRRGGPKAVRTFSSERLANDWVKVEEARIEQIAATGVIPTKATVADPIDHYIEEERPKKQWGKTKTADLKRLRAAVGKHRASTLTKAHIVNYFTGRANGTAGPVKRQPRTDDRIFPVNPKTVVTYFPRAVEALGFVNLHLHDLRHEAISRLFAAGFRITDVQLISGHRDLKMLSRYTHITVSDVHAQAHRLKAA